MEEKVYRIVIRFTGINDNKQPIVSSTYGSPSSALQYIPAFLNERKIAIGNNEYIIHVVECEIQEVQTIIYVVDHKLPESNPIAKLFAES